MGPRFQALKRLATIARPPGEDERRASFQALKRLATIVRPPGEEVADSSPGRARDPCQGLQPLDRGPFFLRARRALGGREPRAPSGRGDLMSAANQALKRLATIVRPPGEECRVQGVSELRDLRPAGRATVARGFSPWAAHSSFVRARRALGCCAPRAPAGRGDLMSAANQALKRLATIARPPGEECGKGFPRDGVRDGFSHP